MAMILLTPIAVAVLVVAVLEGVAVAVVGWFLHEINESFRRVERQQGRRRP